MLNDVDKAVSFSGDLTFFGFVAIWITFMQKLQLIKNMLFHQLIYRFNLRTLRASLIIKLNHITDAVALISAENFITCVTLMRLKWDQTTLCAS